MAGSAERAKKLKESRERAKEISKTVNRAPFSPKEDNTKTSVGSKVRKESRPKPTSTKLNEALTPTRTPAGSKVRKESRDNKATQTKFVQKKTATGDTPKKVSTRGNPLKDRPRTIAEAKKRGEMYFFDSKGVKKLAVTKADLDKTGLSLREYANKFAKKKQTKKDAEALKPYALKKRGGGVMKKKSYAGGGAMKKKGMAAGGRTTMKKQMMRGGGMTGMKKKMYAGGGKMKKGYAIGGAMKKKGMKKGGKTMKMRGGGLATRGTNFTIR